MKKILCITFLGFLFLVVQTNGQEVIQKGRSYYLSHTVVLKFKKNIFPTRQILGKSVPDFNIDKLTQMFPAQASLNKGEESLSRIYLLNYNSADDPVEVAAKISKQSEIEWAEPKYVQRVTFSPNDSLYVLNQQKNLERIHAKEAWDIIKGDSSIVIAIVDTGVDWEHPDLKANVWYDQGVFVGTDLGGDSGTPDNDPREDYSAQNKYHGTHVAGIACAVTNNQKGIASIGYNCSFIPIKASQGNLKDAGGYPYITVGYDGIIYAANKKARVINCSWGGFDYSRLGQDAIDYAISKGAIVVASAGNDGELTDFYPASFKGVISVGWLETDSDVISIAANYGRTVDVFAPGTKILSTYPNNTYTDLLSGSSMSAPLVSGLAGLTFSKFKNYSPLQIAEQIRVTSDDIESSNNSSYKYLLGRGRVNAFKAVSDTSTISVRATNVQFIEKGNGNGLLESGETVSLEITFTNYLKAVDNVSVQLVNYDNDSSIDITNPNFSTGQMKTLDTLKNISNRFEFTIHPDAPLNHELNLLLKFSGNGYNDFQWISTKINPTYDTHNIGKITMSITSKGALGFNDYPNNLEGSGFRFNGGDNLLFEGAFMYGTSGTKLMDAARITAKQSTDFATLVPFKIKSYVDEQDGYTVFSDAGAGSNALGIETRLATYSYSNPPDDKYIILKSTLKNKSSININNLYAGYFFDWDLPADAPSTDTTFFDATDNFGVAYDKSGAVNTYVGAALISSTNFGFYPIDNNATSGEIILFDSNGFTDAEKYISISSGVKKISFAPTDISFVVSGGPFNINANDSVSIGFSVAAGSTLTELRDAIRQSRLKYPNVRTDVKEKNNSIPTEFKLYQNYPNPFNPNTDISYQLSALSHVILKVFDVLGREIKTLVDVEQMPGVYKAKFDGKNLSSGIYFYTLRTGNYVATKKMILLK